MQILSRSFLFFLSLLLTQTVVVHGFMFDNFCSNKKISIVPKIKLIAGVLTLSTLLTNFQSKCLADSRSVGDIPTSGIFFRDSLKISAISDPKVPGVTLFLSDFDRPINEKLSSNFFDDPSSSSLTCAQTGPIGELSKDVSKGPEGQEVFEESRNLVFKQIRIRRVYDAESNSLVYASYNTRFNKNDDTNKSRFKSSICAVHINY